MFARNLILFLLILISAATSEIRSQNAVSASAGQFTGAGGSISFSAGLVSYITNTACSGIHTQGVQHPFETTISISGIVNGSTTVCAGLNSTLLRLTGHTGAILKWQFTTNNFVWYDIADTTETFTAENLNIETIYRAIVFNGGCEYPSSPATISIFPLPLPNPTIAGPDSACYAFTCIYATDPGMSGYYWSVSQGGIIISGEGTNEIRVVWNDQGAQSVSVNCVNSEGCSALMPTTMNVTVNPAFPVSVIIEATANNVCTGSSIGYTASAVNAGSDPVYQWKVNGNDTGSNSPWFMYAPLNGDVVSCIVTSSVKCGLNNPATSNAITMTVYPAQEVGISISPEFNPVCEGNSVILSSVITNGGTSPVFQWFVNGINTGGNDPHLNFVPADHDTIICILTSSEPCTFYNPVTSNNVIMHINPLPVPEISGPETVVAGSTGVVYTAQSGQNQYSWNISPGGTITSGGTSADSMVVVTWTVPGQQWIAVNFTSSQTGCRAADPTKVVINVENPYITITTPNGGENWLNGSLHSIVWSDNILGAVKIELFKSGLYLNTIVDSAASTGTYQWAIPATLVPSADYRVKVTSLEDTTLFAISNDNFTVSSNIEVNRVIRDLVVIAGQSVCFDALFTITVAGEETVVIVEGEGSMTLIAGRNILFLPGLKVEPGGYMHGYITPDGIFCGSMDASMVTVEGKETGSNIQGAPDFRIYPNPTNGRIILELQSIALPGTIKVEIYDMQGKTILSDALAGCVKYEFSIADRPSGIYLIRITSSKHTETVKILKQ